MKLRIKTVHEMRREFSRPDDIRKDAWRSRLRATFISTMDSLAGCHFESGKGGLEDYYYIGPYSISSDMVTDQMVDHKNRYKRVPQNVYLKRANKPKQLVHSESLAEKRKRRAMFIGDDPFAMDGDLPFAMKRGGFGMPEKKKKKKKPATGAMSKNKRILNAYANRTSDRSSK
jgi:hypothetical protein